MDIKCCACGRMFKYSVRKGTGQELLKGAYACQECCDLVGIPKGLKGAFKASTYDKVKFLKKYVEIKPEAKDLLDNAIVQKEHDKAEFRRELKDIAERSTWKERTETMYTCKMCGKKWFVGEEDIKMNLINALACSVYSVNQIKDFEKCPDCGSRASTKKKIKIWLDKHGNCVDIKE